METTAEQKARKRQEVLMGTQPVKQRRVQAHPNSSLGATGVSTPFTYNRLSEGLHGHAPNHIIGSGHGFEKQGVYSPAVKC